MKWLIFVLAACSSKGPTAPANVASGSAEVRPYKGDPLRGPCHAASDCKLRDVCGCSCEAALATAAPELKCDESCPDHDVCKGYEAGCELPTQTCSVIPPVAP